MSEVDQTSAMVQAMITVREKVRILEAEKEKLHQDLAAAKELVGKLKERCELGQTVGALLDIEQWESNQKAEAPHGDK